MQARIADYNLGSDVADVIAKQLERHAMTHFGEKQSVTLESSRNILLASI